jgi:hypothetical protein
MKKRKGAGRVLQLLVRAPRYNHHYGGEVAV